MTQDFRKDRTAPAHHFRGGHTSHGVIRPMHEPNRLFA